MGKPRFTPAERAAQRAYRGRAKREHTDCPAHGTDHERYAGGCLDCPACIDLRHDASGTKRPEDEER